MTIRLTFLCLKRHALLGFCFCITWVATLIGAVEVFSVEPGKPSWTAEAVTAFRAIGAHEPDEKLRNSDYLAEKFVNPRFMRTDLGLSEDFDLARKGLEARGTFPYYYVNARTKHIDAIVRREGTLGLKQVVILGSGYDSRAYRFREILPDVKFFEVDLPATQEQKKKRITDILGYFPDWVSYAPIDFNKQTLKDVLLKAGYDSTKRTLFIWEGVTYFISGEGVDSTLNFIANHSIPGSSVVFDYMLRCVIDGDFSRFPYAQGLFRRVAMRGEPYIFGIKEGKAEKFVNQRGLTVVSDLGAKDLTSRYLVGSNGQVKGFLPGFIRIMQASVGKASHEKKAALIIPYGGYHPGEYSITREELEKRGLKIVVVSTRSGKAKSSDNESSTDVDLVVDDLDIRDFDIIAFIGGYWFPMEIPGNKAAREIAKNAAKKGKVLGGICAGRKFLMDLDIIDYRLTEQGEPGKFVVVQDNVVTAAGPSDSRYFARKLLEILEKQ